VPLNRIKILNPVGGPGWTSIKRAIKDVRRGRARLVREGVIEYIRSDSDPRDLAVMGTARLAASGYDRASCTGIASIQAIRGLPVAGPAERLLTERRRRST
jgi:hypothetical protein